jgi:hypothetical protein
MLSSETDNAVIDCFLLDGDSAVNTKCELVEIWSIGIYTLFDDSAVNSAYNRDQHTA